MSAVAAGLAPVIVWDAPFEHLLACYDGTGHLDLVDGLPGTHEQHQRWLLVAMMHHCFDDLAPDATLEVWPLLRTLGKGGDEVLAGDITWSWQPSRPGNAAPRQLYPSQGLRIDLMHMPPSVQVEHVLAWNRRVLALGWEQALPIWNWISRVDPEGPGVAWTKAETLELSWKTGLDEEGWAVYEGHRIAQAMKAAEAPAPIRVRI